MSRAAFVLLLLGACASPPPRSDAAPAAAPAPLPAPDAAPAPAPPPLPAAEVLLDGRGDITALAHDGDTLYWIESSGADAGADLYRLPAGATAPTRLAGDARGLEQLC